MDIIIIGLDEVGASIGLALGEHEGTVQRFGYDPDKQTGKKALEIGAVDELLSHPRKASSRVDAAILSIPLNEKEAYLDLLGEKMKENAVIIDTGRLKSPAIQAASEYLPESIAYIGLTPIIGPDALVSAYPGTIEPRADLFQGGLAAMVIPPATSEAASEFALGLATVLGATPFFIEAGEHDAVTAVEDGLPFIFSSAFMNMMTTLPNWRESRRLVGANFAAFAGFIGLHHADDLGTSLHQSRDVLLAKLDDFNKEIDQIRAFLEMDDPEELIDYLARAEVSRNVLIKARERADWSGEELEPSRMKEAGSFVGNLFGLTPRPPREEP